MTILVTGGAGYIGSHTIIQLLRKGYDVISVDNFINSSPIIYDLIEKITGKKIVHFNVDLQNFSKLEKIFIKYKNNLKCIIHFGALKSVFESVKNPYVYFKNNNTSTINITKLAIEYSIYNLIFSSSCSVYGEIGKENLPVNEKTERKKATSPYAYTKEIGEMMLKFMSDNTDLKVICLRYFNPGGAYISGEIGCLPSKMEDNLVPIIGQVASGTRKYIEIFGNDWDTRDGTCIRDYIHVMDIADGHINALEYMIENNNVKYDVINFGTGNGVTVYEMIKAFEIATNQKINFKFVNRRPGDVESVFADNQKAKTLLNWELKRDIKDIMKSEWLWQLKMKELKII